MSVASSTLRLVPLLESIRPEMEQMESVLFERVSNVPDPLGSMLRHALGSGKRWCWRMVSFW